MSISASSQKDLDDPLVPLNASNSMESEITSYRGQPCEDSEPCPCGRSQSYGTITATARNLDTRPICNYSRNSSSFNDAYIVNNYAVALPHHVYQRLHRQSIISPSISPQETMSRVENLSEMRPFHLVGISEPLCDWEALHKDQDVIDTLKNKALKEFYTHQNEIIDRYEEIDQMLGTGFQIDMLREYGSDLHEIHSHGESLHRERSSESGPTPQNSQNLRLVKVCHTKWMKNLPCLLVYLPTNITDWLCLQFTSTLSSTFFY